MQQIVVIWFQTLFETHFFNFQWFHLVIEEDINTNSVISISIDVIMLHETYTYL